MGRGLEVLTGFATAPGVAAFAALTMAAGNSATVRSAKEGARVRMLQAWADNQAAGTLRIRSPRLHDANQGIRLDIIPSDVAPLFPLGYQQTLFPQDGLILEITGSAVGGQIETAGFLVYYDDLPGVEARLITAEEYMRRYSHLFPVENTLALGVAGGYSGEEAINAEFDFFKNNIDYALVGYLVDTECAVVRWRGSDTGNLGVGGPGNESLRHVTANWFLRLAKDTGLPLIPVFNAANKAGILIDGAQDQVGADVTVTSIFAELSPGGAVAR